MARKGKYERIVEVSNTWSIPVTEDMLFPAVEGVFNDDKLPLGDSYSDPYISDGKLIIGFGAQEYSGYAWVTWEDSTSTPNDVVVDGNGNTVNITINQGGGLPEGSTF